MARTATVVAVAAGLVAATAAPAAAHGGAPAGGAALGEVVVASAVAVALAGAVAAVGWAHRLGRSAALSRAAAWSERVSGLPGWAALPLAIAGASLLVAVFGFYWDVATHIDNGRDPGPFANPSHWFIIVGLLGIALAGVVSVLLGTDEDEPSSVRLRGGWYAPVGGLLLLLCGVVALLGFPLDDVWHRIFGQDVTLWSPTHIQMVGGASLSTVALWVLLVEARRSAPRAGTTRPRLLRVREVLVAGAVLVGASTLQAEFDFGVPQFRLLYQPVLVALAAGVALVPARIRLGRGGALVATAVYLALRGGLTLLVSGWLDRILLHAPLYLGAALAVELVALRVPRDRQLALGAWSGLAIGTAGLAAEWGWSQVGMPLPWTAALFPEVVAVAVPAAVAGGVVGGFLGRALERPGVPTEPAPRWLAPAAGLVVVGALAYPLPTTGVDAAVELTLQDVPRGEERWVEATVEFEPSGVARGAEWLTVTAWQGADWTDRTSIVDRLERVGPGTYRTTTPIPVHGDWKALVRLHRGRVMAGAPIYLPEDPAIPAEAVPAEPHATRDLVPDRQLLLREMRPAPPWLTSVAYGVLGAIVVAWVGATVWGVRRLRLTRPDARPAVPVATAARRRTVVS